MFPSENLREGLSEKDKGDLIFPSVLFHVAQQGKCRYCWANTKVAAIEGSVLCGDAHC